MLKEKEVVRNCSVFLVGIFLYGFFVLLIIIKWEEYKLYVSILVYNVSFLWSFVYISFYINGENKILYDRKMIFINKDKFWR